MKEPLVNGRKSTVAGTKLAIGLLSFVSVCITAETHLSQSSAEFVQVHKTTMPYNARSCSECHGLPMIGGSSRVTVLRAGDRASGRYEGIGVTGTLHSQGERNMQSAISITGLRVAVSLLGDGLIEAVPDEELKSIAARQLKETHGVIDGEYTMVSTPGGQSGERSVGRFGWKAQHSTILSASAEAMNSELGIPNDFFPGSPDSSENTGTTAQISSDTESLNTIVKFIRFSSPVLPDAERSATSSARAGAVIFQDIGCSLCHVRTLHTAAVGSRVGAGSVTVSESLADRDIHPFSDYLLHDVGTGDGIIQNIRPEDYAESSADKFRTAPL